MYGPPLLSEILLLKLLKIIAKTIAPKAEINHPIKLMEPYFASAAGNTNTPAPIILPTTREVAEIRPIF